MNRIMCDYCGLPAQPVNGGAIYPHRPDLHAKVFWLCRPCGAYVGVHKGTVTPLGRLANADLRAAKIAAHGAFDSLWRGRKMQRSEAYAWLSVALGIDPSRCHIGMMDVADCHRVVRAVRDRDREMEDR